MPLKLIMETEPSDATIAERPFSDVASEICAAEHGILAYLVRSLTVRLLYGLGMVLGFVVALIPALLTRVESLFTHRGEILVLCGQALSIIPGLPGSCVRVCFYYLTLKACPLNCRIGFLSSIHDRRAELGEKVNIGAFVSIGRVRIGARSLIASRSSLMSGSRQHELGLDGRLSKFDGSQALCIEIGEDTWIGENSMIMADIGHQTMICAGSVVTKPVPDRQLWGGNPARFIKRLIPGSC